MYKRLFFLSVLLLLLLSKAYAQGGNEILFSRVLENGDTMYFGKINDVIVVGRFLGKNKGDWKQYRRMVYNLKRVYPYTQIAKKKLSEMDAHFDRLKTKKERKAYIDKVEKDILSEFEGPLRKLTRSQGKMLIKLVDREVGRSSYTIVKEFKGGFATFFWQNIGRLFGYNLKMKYDPNGEDALLEELVQMCENGTFEMLYYSMFYE